MKANYIKENDIYRYFDKEGNELNDGDTIRWASGKTEKVYRTQQGLLGTDATNPAWIASGRACECEYGIYPLTYSDLKEIVKA